MKWTDAAMPPTDITKKYVVKTVTTISALGPFSNFVGHTDVLFIGLHVSDKGKVMWNCSNQKVTEWLDESPEDNLVKCGNCDQMVEMVSSGEFCPRCFC